MSDKKVIVNCEVVEKTFTKETGEVIPYFDCHLVFGDTLVKVNVKQDEKPLFKHLIKEFFM